MTTPLEFIAEQIIQQYRSKGSVTKTFAIHVAAKTAEKFQLDTQPQLAQLLPLLPYSFHSILLKKPVRSASGVQVIAVMCKPHRCPQQAKTGSSCTYCGGGADSDFQYSSQSYTGYEPTSMRAIRARYDPVEQTRGRLEQLKSLGHDAGKYEVVLMGGTFMSLDQTYRDFFIKGIYQGITGYTAETVNEAVQNAEVSHQKLVALTIETRPDYCEPRHIAQMLRYGTTRLEIGVQSVYPDVIAHINRGHTSRATARCFGQSRDAGFKMIAHMMPNLPLTTVERDIRGFQELFTQIRYRPDGLKIYPTLVIRGTKLYEDWRTGKYKRRLPHNELIQLLADMLCITPPYVRIYRIMRDIPLPLVTSGVESANLREEALAELTRRGRVSMEIRQREVGIIGTKSAEMQRKFDVKNSFFGRNQLEIVRRDYSCSGSIETFLSLEQPSDAKNPPVLHGLLRLRLLPRGGKPAASGIRAELRGAVSLIREVHVYGQAVGVSKKSFSEQHRGVGKILIAEAEKIARIEHKSCKVTVIAGVGTRGYYSKWGYQLDGVYMSKMIQ
ncbi:Histone acetyltransferase Elp3 [Spironucleus salmonicida]|uniref:Elongator complex protein 3 n=1 Tax=Spironucleus salmonicida TaxID=348837 RepID=V6LX38_9EUKA|nr:Histone acetyltransferase Elp3 [Spironucleus salmonicida]|eukprot:EST49177.1 Histone acetyltransferase Elp3 [Spironucleus salmonicida]